MHITGVCEPGNLMPVGGCDPQHVRAQAHLAHGHALGHLVQVHQGPALELEIVQLAPVGGQLGLHDHAQRVRLGDGEAEADEVAQPSHHAGLEPSWHVVAGAAGSGDGRLGGVVVEPARNVLGVDVAVDPRDELLLALTGIGLG